MDLRRLLYSDVLQNFLLTRMTTIISVDFWLDMRGKQRSVWNKTDKRDWLLSRSRLCVRVRRTLAGALQYGCVGLSEGRQ